MNAIVPPLLWFLLSFDPSLAAQVFFMAAIEGGFSRYDFWLLRLVERFDAPNEHILILTQKPIKSELAYVYWPKPGERPDERFKDFYGLVIIDAHFIFHTTSLLRFCYEAMVEGGKTVLVHDRHIDAVLTKQK